MTEDSAPRRGAHLLDAVLDLIAESGFGGVSMRTVAARAGVSVAQVQYYFRSKNELIKAGFDHVSEQFLADVLPLQDAEPSLERLRDIISQWLPLDDQRERRARVWVAYAATALTDPTLASESARLDAELRTWFTDELGTLRRDGHIRAEVPVDVAAAQLFALVNGITIEALVLPNNERAELVNRTIQPFLTDLAP